MAPKLKDLAALAQDLRRLATEQREDVRIRARLLGRKLPQIGQGLRYMLKSNKQEALSIGRFIEKNATERPDAPALLFEDRRYTHREFHEESNRWAHALAAAGVQKGDAVAVLLENRPELLFVVAGIVKLGAIAACINTKQRGRVLEHSFSTAKAKVAVIGEELWDAFAEVQGKIASAPQAWWLRDDGQGAAPAGTVDGAAKAAAAQASTPAALANVTLGDPCFYVYTSGTTGMPKASIMSHFRWAKAAGVFGLAALALGPADVLYVPLPLYHNNALTVAWGSASAAGAAIALRRKFSVSQFWEDVRKYRATSFVYIGELCRYLLNQPVRPDDRAHQVTRMCGNGLRPDIWKAFKTRFGIDEVYEFYAASEGNIAFCNLFNLDCTVGFCPAKYVLVKYDVDRDDVVRDPAGHLIAVGRGEVGLLIGEVSDRYAFDGYTDKAASEKKLFRNAFLPGDTWFNSGDLMRDQGFRHAQFVDRVGDTFRWKGENVSTNEVAEVLNGFGQIAESTVYGVTVPGADGRCGMAALVTSVAPAEFDAAGFARHVRAQLPAYAWPLFLRLRPEAEVTGTFKQMKGELKAQGFARAKVNEPLWVLLPKNEAYVPLTESLEARLQAGEVSL